MKIQKIQQLCKAAKRIMIINDEAHGIQWISDGYCIYPLFNLPRLTRENIFALFDIPEEKQGKIFFDERDELPTGLDFSDVADGERVVSPENYSINAHGRSLAVIKGAEGGQLFDKKYLAPFDDDAVLYERCRKYGHPYIVAKEGMFLAGVILPFEAREELAEWLVNIGEQLIVTA